ncbi:Synaptosomal-associated protein [Dermatophagoides farinae]|uniref:Synaptosomal-associated protein n=1 Tax=Dermatophagoides farinae TaxID=6954 RepID=A0A922IF30_DERFA|nr:synaptosomal-associated protein 29-like [Dermatophagoides farinae]KAH7642369.1 synaptosomal-associated protein 29-like protein [Dermatophagoides farinae]KAH9529592.1 Synaptosomal-associated protein [Dermatophagoides farinae]
MSYMKNGSIPEFEDVDDSTFLNHPRQGSKGYILSNNNDPSSSMADKRLQLFEERRRIEEQTLQSTKNSLGLIYETEKIGVHTAEELLHQREQLDNVNEKLDSINSIMRMSQKHISSMKSMFGGFKNMFSKNQDPKNLPPVNTKKISSSASDNKLQHTLENISKNTSVINDSRISHKFDVNDDMNSRNMPDKTKNLSSYEIRSQEIDQQLDENLSEMGLGISRLKELALGLGTEIDSQNKLLDTIATKSEKAQDTVSNQNRQMNRILKG